MLYENRCEDGCKTKNTYFSGRLYRAYKNKCGKTGKGTSKKKPAYGGLRRSRRMSSHQESPAASQRLLSILPKLALQTVQRRAKKKAKEMSKTLCHTCLPTVLATTKKPPNAWNQKEDSRVTCIMSFLKKKHTLQCFSLFILQINFVGHFNDLRAGELRAENSCRPFGGMAHSLIQEIAGSPVMNLKRFLFLLQSQI